jgi:hypothetical protein
MSKQTIQLSEDFRIDEPLAYLVLCPVSCPTCEYRVYANRLEACDRAHDINSWTNTPTDKPTQVYPLYASIPFDVET